MPQMRNFEFIIIIIIVFVQKQRYLIIHVVQNWRHGLWTKHTKIRQAVTVAFKKRKARCIRDITRYFFLIRWSTDGTCWISGQSMHLAWIY